MRAHRTSSIIRIALIRAKWKRSMCHKIGIPEAND